MVLLRRITVYANIVALIALLTACNQVPSTLSSTTAPAPIASVATISAPIPPSAPIPTTAVVPTGAATAVTAQSLADVCTLITPSEAAVALGTGTTLPKPQALTGTVPGCSFQGDSEEQIRLFVHRYSSLKEALQAQQASVDPIKDLPTFQKITGLGDEAFAMGRSIAVRKQMVILTLSVTTTKSAISSTLIARGLAQKVLSRLP